MGTGPKSRKVSHIGKLITNKLKKRKYENFENAPLDDDEGRGPPGRSIEVMPWEEELKLNMHQFDEEDFVGQRESSYTPGPANPRPVYETTGYGREPNTGTQKKKKKKLRKRVKKVTWRTMKGSWKCFKEGMIILSNSTMGVLGATNFIFSTASADHSLSRGHGYR